MRTFFSALAPLLAIAAACLPLSLPAQQLSVLAPAPDWTELERFQETITRAEFQRLLEEVYAPGGAAQGIIELRDSEAVIKTQLRLPATWTLRFAPDASSRKPIPRFWKPAAELPPPLPGKPLQGLHIAIDPGHLGGAWARMEERWFRIGESQPVMEGEMTLRVANLIAPQLEALGAKVSLLRHALEPVTPDRPASLHEAARAELQRSGRANAPESYASPDDPLRGGTVQWQSELLFYRTSEIRHRAELVNRELQPDLTLCLHFNAEAWGDPRTPEFVPRNHLHLLLNGCYSAGELRYDDIRFDMLVKLLNGSFHEEAEASTVVAESLAKATQLAPYTYNTGNAIRVGGNAYLWARNLLANRVYRNPVVFLEPYVMNSLPVWERVQAGDYEGTRMVAGEQRKSIYREYADGVVEGVRRYYTQARAK